MRTTFDITDDVSMFDATRFQHNRIHSSLQITDLYLLAIAVNWHRCVARGMSGQFGRGAHCA